jgi:PAS domain S-box-containing protein
MDQKRIGTRHAPRRKPRRSQILKTSPEKTRGTRKTAIHGFTREADLGSTAPIRRRSGQKESAEEQIRSLARFPGENPNPILRVTRKGAILYANESCRILGDKRLTKVGGLIPPDWLALVERGFVGGATQEADLTIGPKVFLVTVVPFSETGYANLYGNEITEHWKKEDELKRLNRTLKAISGSNQEMMRAGSESGFMEAVCRIIVENCGHSMVWIGLANQDEGHTVTPVASFGFDAGYLDTLHITWADSERGRGPTGTAIRIGKVSMCRNMLTDPKFQPWRAEALRRGYAASIALPLAADGKVFGAITIYSREPDPFSEEEVALLSELASDLSYGISALRTRAARDGLMAQVEEQRRLAQQSEAVARRQTDELDATFGSMSEAVLVYNPDSILRRVNEAGVRIFGTDPTGLAISEIFARFSVRYADGRPVDPAARPTSRALAGATIAGERYFLTGADGRTATVQIASAPLREGERIVGAVTVMHDVTEREHLLGEMQRRAAELDTVINSIADGVMVYDTDSQIIRLNPAAARITGYSPTDFGLSIRDRTPKVIQIESIDGRPVSDTQATPVPRALRGETVQGEVMGLRQNRTGAFRWVSVSAAPLRTPDGTVFGAVSTLTDITERMETENELVRIRAELESRVKERTRELEEANSYNRSLIDATIDPLVTITLDGKIGDVNPATEAVTGFPRQDLIGKDFSSYFTDEERARAGYRRVFSEGKVSDYELEIRHKDGRVTPVLYNASIYTDESLNVKGVIAAARDITRRKQTEAQLRENARRVEVLAEISHLLAEAGPNYQTVMDTIADLVAQLLGEECLIHLPSAGGQLNLASHHRAAGGGSEPSTSDPSGVLERLIERVFQAKKPLFLPTVSAETIRRASGTENLPPLQRTSLTGLLAVPLIVQDAALGTLTVTRSTPNTVYTVSDLTLLRSVADRVALAITNSHLYSDLKNALAEEQKAQQQLIQTEKLAAMGRLLGSVAHELNNPLQTIKNCLYLVQQEAPAVPAIRNYIDMASSETQRLVHLVAELRELYRPASDKAVQPYDLAEILREVRASLHSQLQNGNVQWQQAPKPRSCIVRCEKERIQQVFINLAVNAIEAMQPGGGTLSVDMILSDDSRRVGVLFQDTGPGIPPELRKNLFEPFVTTKPTGLGLGLPICYEIAQKHGGQITVESQPGQGAAFTLWLPSAESG